MNQLQSYLEENGVKFNAELWDKLYKFERKEILSRTIAFIQEK